ncbi:MAG: hypothetical protein CMJ26_04380 [Phycisphaerae bacterium]|nr:hypothetical protein [Phycisphaerae bacterium]|tara:strand:- start:1502 stop:1756 length:255 start_codon:yes stop_codon:yes gene_type:complete
MFLAVGFTDILPAIILLLAFTIVGGVVIFGLRRKLKQPPSTTIAFTLGDLKRLRDEGSISQQEYERAKDSIITSVKKTTTDISK